MRIQLWDCAAAVQEGESVILLYGRTSLEDKDLDICLRVHGVWPYIYIPKPAGLGGGASTSSPVETIETALRRKGMIREAQLVSRTDVVGFNVPTDVWKLTLNDHRNIYNLREAINRGEIASNFSRKSYLTDFPYTSLAQIELGVPNCGWFSVDASLLAQQCVFRVSTCALEYRLDFMVSSGVGQPLMRSIQPLDETLYAAIPSRIRVASLDIECDGRLGVFPEPEHDAVIQIGTFVCVHGEKTPLSFTIHTWRTASLPQPAGYFEASGHRAEYVLCRNEADTIEQWATLMRSLGVDLYTGWNIADFDLPYIVRRASFLPQKPDISGLGRHRGAEITAKPSRFSSKQLGTRESYTLTNLEGVHVLDEFIEVLRSRRERSYRLDHIARIALAHKTAYEFSLVESAWLVRARSVQILGLGAKVSDSVSTAPMLFTPASQVRDRSIHSLEPLPLKAGDYRLTLSRQNKSSFLFLRFFDDAQRCIGFACCERASDQHKVDVHYTQIKKMWHGSDDDRQLLASYNLVDALLPWQIMCELRTLGNYIEQARVTKTDITTQLQQGQNVKSTMLLQWEAKRAGFIVPYLPPRIKERMGNCEPVPDSLWFRHDLDAAARAGTTVVDAEEEMMNDDDDDLGAKLEAGKGNTKFTGGYVGDMEAKFYSSSEPIATLDFESLYPSLMMSHNLCPTTQVIDRSQLQKAGLTLERDCVESPIAGVYFVKQEIRRGLLPTILDQVLTARRAAKKAMAAEKDLGAKESLDGRQLALKITANSVYGFCGNPRGTLPCLYVAASVTTYGKAAILFSKAEVERVYPGSKVIYIDTDSLFVRNPNCKTVAEAIEFGLEASKHVTQLFMAQSSNNRRVLAFEKVNCPFLGMAPKRYASLYWTRPEDPDMVYERGVETVRRDVPLLVSETMSAVFFLILWCGDVQGACEIVRLVVSQLWMCEVPMSKLVMAKEFKKEVYANMQPHAQVVAKMRKRDAATAPKLGDRVPYVITPHDHKKTSVSDAAESPDYCLANDIYPDQAWYVDQLETCLSRVLTLVIGADQTRLLFHVTFEDTYARITGEHTLRRKMILPKSGGLFDFIKRGDEAKALISSRAATDDDDNDSMMFGGATTTTSSQQQPPKRSATMPTPAAAPAAKKKAAPAKKQKSLPAGAGIAAFFTRQPDTHTAAADPDQTLVSLE